jgi:hypothetical protein
MAKKRKKAKKDDFVVADFGHKDAKGSGGRIRIPEGDYVAKIVKAEKTTAKESGNTMIVWTLKILEGKYKGKEIRTRTVMTPKALFFLRSLLEALGKEVPEKASKIRYQQYVGERIGITVEDNEYNNKISSEVSDFLDPDMVGADEDDEDEDDDLDEDDEGSDEDDDDDDEDEDEDLDEVDLDEL